MRLDLVTAIRQLRRAPATALAAIVTLAVGIGATTAVFSFVAAVLSAGSPVDDMDRMVSLWSHNRTEAETKGLVSAADYLAWQSRARSFDSIAASESRSFNLSGIGTPIRASATAVTAGYLELFRWRPFLGRSFTRDDFQSGAPRVIVATYQFWTTNLGADNDIIGRTVRLDGEPATIIGVLPRMPASSGIYLPAQLDARREDRGTRTLFVFARLRAGVSIEQARSEMMAIGESLEREYPQTNRGWALNTRPLQEDFVGPQARLVFGLLAGTVFAVLLIGCVNIANLLLARGAAREGELAVRLALGAGGWRVVRQLLVECAVLAALGALLSLAVSRWTINVLMALGSLDSPWVANAGVNARVLLLTAVLSVFATCVAGLAPALAARRADLIRGLHHAGRSSGRGTRRTTRVLVASQVALAVMLLIVAGLAMRTLVAIERLEPGFDMDNVLTAAVTLPEGMPEQAAARWFDMVLTRTRQLPGVISAGATSRLPFAGSRWNPNRGLEIEGQAAADGTEGRWAVDYVITPGLLETLRVRIVAGRTFGDQDGAGAPLVAIINQAMARRFWPTRSPLGARLSQADDPSGQWRTVVGVVADIRNDDADQPPLPYLYTPLAQRPSRTMTLTLRSAGDPLAFADPLRRAVASLDPDQALYDMTTMRAVWESDLRGSRILIQVMAALALIALGLAGLGVWGVAAQSVGQRTREIGVRIALGASAGQVGRLIAWQGFVPIAVGLVAGVLGGLALGQVMRSILFQVTPTDPVTLAITLAVLASVGIAATLGPALRAARLDPLVALRTE
jgi:putative ABC transport system permease protein